ncbi:MAG: hypothetical protein PWP14_1581 [Methanolobus sp.]|nr:hypothetical protein [Methanolobus sp.]
MQFTIKTCVARVAVRQIIQAGKQKAILLPEDFGNVGDPVCFVRKDEKTIVITKG